jgi:uncharacterized membrane protein (DUF373 family)
MANHISDPSAAGRFRLLPDTAEHWSNLSLYGRFEQAVALALTLLVSGVILVALADLIAAIAGSLLVPGLPVLDHAVFQGVFGMIMTVLIAMEFNHTILSILHRKKSIVQLRTVILIAMLALARKFIIVDLSAATPTTIAALGFAVLCLGSVYWLIRQQDQSDDVS